MTDDDPVDFDALLREPAADIDRTIDVLGRELAAVGDRAKLAKINPLTVAREILDAAEVDDPERWAKATESDRLRRLAADYMALLRESVELRRGSQ